VTAEKTFKATEKNMNVDITFTFDATLLKTTQTVVFEDLYQGDVHVATHSDLKDRNQSVEFNPKKKTPFTPAEKSKTPVKTWDDTPIAGKIAVIAAALAAAGAAVYVSRRKKKADD
jgi:phosphotransferase system  glucose/maltose/N-acetylglucosamine-specific IIC component